MSGTDMLVFKMNWSKYWTITIKDQCSVL